MWGASGRIIRTIIAQENCPAMPHGCWYATAWAVHAAGREASSQSACDVIERCFQEQYNQCLPGEEETFLKKSAAQRQPLCVPKGPA